MRAVAANLRVLTPSCTASFTTRYRLLRRSTRSDAPDTRIILRNASSLARGLPLFDKLALVRALSLALALTLGEIALPLCEILTRARALSLALSRAQSRPLAREPL
jgi:hypothetical protein